MISLSFFAGDGWMLESCKLMAEQMGVIQKIHFWGIRSDIPESIKMSDICILSSKWEGFGLSAVEYMAAGKPVIASNVDGLCEIVRGAGLLFSCGNEAELQTKIELIINNLGLRRNIAEQCKRRAAQYGMSLMTKSYLSLYKSIL